MSNQRIDLLKEYIRQDDTDPFLHYALALELKKIHQSSEALQLLTSLINRFPDYLPTFYQLGLLLEENHQKEQAIEVYRTGLAKAREQKDMKTAGEISEAIQRLEFE